MTDERKPTAAQIISRKRQEIFLKVLARTGKMNIAVAAAGYRDSSPLYRLKLEDEAFAAAWDNALLASADLLEEAAFDRAVHGVSKPILFKGEVVAEEITYSDSILLAMLAARKPEYRRDRTKVDVSVDVNAKIGVAVIPMTAADPKVWEGQAAIVHQGQRQLPDFTTGDGEKIETPGTTEVKPAEAVPVQRELGRG